MTRTHIALMLPDLKGSTLQLAAIPRMFSALDYFKFVGQHLDPAQLYAHLTTYSGRNFVSVYFGNYDTRDQALAALPDVLKVNKPIVRTWAQIKLDGAFEKTNNYERNQYVPVP